MNRQKKRTELPNSAASVLQSALRAYHLENKIHDYAAFPLWPKIVGQEISAVAVPERLNRKKVLIVRVVDAAWLQELSLQKELLLSKLQSVDAGAFIQDIRFVTGGPNAANKTR